MKHSIADYSKPHLGCPVCKKVRNERAKHRQKNAIIEIAGLMVGELANNYIDVDNASEARSAQAHWSLQAQKMLKKLVKEYKKECEESYRGVSKGV